MDSDLLAGAAAILTVIVTLLTSNGVSYFTYTGRLRESISKNRELQNKLTDPKSVSILDAHIREDVWRLASANGEEAQDEKFWLRLGLASVGTSAGVFFYAFFVGSSTGSIPPLVYSIALTVLLLAGLFFSWVSVDKRRQRYQAAKENVEKFGTTTTHRTSK